MHSFLIVCELTLELRESLVTIILSDVTLYPILEKWPCCNSAFRGLDTMPDSSIVQPTAGMRSGGASLCPHNLSVLGHNDSPTFLPAKPVKWPLQQFHRAVFTPYAIQTPVATV